MSEASQGPSPAGTKPAPNCTLVIFGAGGDLTKRLLMPALYNLSGSRLLDPGFKVIGIDRAERSDDDWRQSLTETIQSFTKDPTAEFHTDKIDEAAWGWLTQRLHYMAADFTRPETFSQLREALGAGSVIFYLAVAARFFGPIVEQLGHAGLLQQSGQDFRRVVVEKPFGADLASAQALNRTILAQADESQIYRIDHFLGKETVQSLMAVRFANGIFEPLWRRDYIDHVQITAAETIGIELRGKFYEPTGALRDMVPNHLFSLLCMVAMEPPASFAPEAVRSEKSKLLESVRPLGHDDIVRGQYAAGTITGKPVPGYRQEQDVAPDSATETYVAARLTIDNWRWGGTPFYLRTGKRLAARRTEIAIHFKPAPYRLFRDTPVECLAPNVLKLLIDPDQGMETQFAAKVPGPTMRLGPVETSLRYRDFFEEKPNVGYETLLYDCMLGDATLFQRADGIEASWAIVEPALEAWSRGGEPQPYAAGSEGPEAAAALLARDGRQWLPLTE